MRWGLMVTTAAFATVCLSAVVVVSAAHTTSTAGGTPVSVPAPASIPALPPSTASALAPTAASVSPSASASAAVPASAPASGPTVSPAASAPSTDLLIPTTVRPTTVRPTTVRTSSSAPAVLTGGALPLAFATGAATEVITVVAAANSSTTAVLQAWTRAPGGGWLRYGSALTAHVGSAGLTTHPSESLSATPIGSFSLTWAFGADANPGSGLPYHQTTPADWWISQPGALYNTMRTCESSCPFTQGDPNEHLYYETPFYNYAVVINYNTAPVVAGAGSAFFLHVSTGTSTAGCVSIPQTNLVTIMKWLNPAAQPRILIGIA